MRVRHESEMMARHNLTISQDAQPAQPQSVAALLLDGGLESTGGRVYEPLADAAQPKAAKKNIGVEL